MSDMERVFYFIGLGFSIGCAVLSALQISSWAIGKILFLTKAHVKFAEFLWRNGR